MITTADVTDRNGAIDMIDYYCNVTDNLLHIKKVLVDGGYTGQNFADEIKRISGAEVEVVKIVRDFCKIPFKCSLWLLSVLFSGDTKQDLILYRFMLWN